MKFTSHLLLFSVSMLIAFLSYGQDYKTGIGIRLGGWNRGVSVKHVVGGSGALEGLVSFGSSSLVITGLYEKHTGFPNAEGLNWFFGGGAHLGFYNDGYDYYYYNYRGNKVVVYKDNGSATSGFGLDFILGLDYKFKKAPINISLDTKPFVDFGREFRGWWDGALTVRFTL